jgi:hypothetical protein
MKNINVEFESLMQDYRETQEVLVDELKANGSETYAARVSRTTERKVAKVKELLAEGDEIKIKMHFGRLLLDFRESMENLMLEVGEDYRIRLERKLSRKNDRYKSVLAQ